MRLYHAGSIEKILNSAPGEFRLRNSVRKGFLTARNAGNMPPIVEWTFADLVSLMA
jgi:hypothetical protein